MVSDFCICHDLTISGILFFLRILRLKALASVKAVKGDMLTHAKNKSWAVLEFEVSLRKPLSLVLSLRLLHDPSNFPFCQRESAPTDISEP